MRKIGDLIYDADFNIYSTTSNQTKPTVYELKRITADWDAATTWDTARPIVDPKVWATNTGCSATNTSQCQARWLEWDVKGLMQHWIDTHAPSNHGWELARPATSSYQGQELASGEHPNPLLRPYVNVWVNAMPGTSTFAMDATDWPKLALGAGAPADGATLPTDSPVFQTKDLTDRNGDPIVVRYEVSESRTSFDASIVYDSGWIAETTSHRVPSGALSKNKQYFWRVQASDLCASAYVDPDAAERDGVDICDDLDRAGFPDERPTSEIRAFTLKPEKTNLGTDRRWAMWRQGLGNGMELAVNQANGNVVLQYPFDTIGTPQRPLALSLAYNSQKAQRAIGGEEEAAPGLPPGWDLAAGPISPQQLPTRLTPLVQATPAGESIYGVAVVTQSGKRDVYVKSTNGVFTQAGPMAGTIRRPSSGGWVLTTYTGGTFVFSEKGSLVRARPSTTVPGTKGFDYTPGVGGRVDLVTDPLGRSVQFDYAQVPGRTDVFLKRVIAFPNEPEESTWTIEYDAGGGIASITDPEAHKVKLAYDKPGRLNSVMDGVESAKASGKATQVAYLDTPPKWTVSKVLPPAVATVAPPALQDPNDRYKLSSFQSGWQFTYDWPGWTGDFARRTTVTSPRGFRTTTPDDYQTIVDFNDIGLPIEERGPRVNSASGARPLTKKVWDFQTGNLVCRRGPAANALDPAPCGDGDGLQTELVYQNRAPYLLTKTTAPAAEPNGARLVTTFSYDEGFRGLQAHYYSNTTLTGVADAFDIVEQMAQDWGESGPPQLGNDTDFSVRYFGELAPYHAEGERDYEFRLTSEDEARLIVGDELLVDCITVSSGKCSGTTTNTGTARGLGTQTVPIAVELQAATGPANVKLEWKQANGELVVVPAASLRPGTNVLTSERTTTTARPDLQAGFTTKTYDYLDAAHRIRGLPTTERLTGGALVAESPAMETAYTYDNHGRVLTEIDATGEPIEHEYTGACETLTVNRVGLEITRACNLFGDLLSETAHVGNLDGQPASTPQQRTTTTTYTRLGRVDTATTPDGGRTDYDYDAAGRLVQTSVLETSAVYRTTNLVYNEQGWVVKELLPDPDGSGSIPRPERWYAYDDDGNAIVTTDERSKKWIEGLDEGSRRITREDPLANKWSWTYDAAGRVKTKEDPHSVKVTFGYDVRDQMTSKALGSLAPETTTYDLRGSIATITDPDGVQTSFRYDFAGRLVEETTPVGREITKYDGSGFPVEEVSRRNRTTTYGYDDMGHLKSVTAPGAYKTEYVLNEAGEVEITRLPGETNASGSWQFDYDKMGRVTREVDAANGVDTFAYNKADEVVSTTDGSGYRIDNVYDRLGRVDKRIAYDIGESGAPDAVEEVVDFVYDAGGNMTAAANDEGTISATYDAIGRVGTVTAEGKTTTFLYQGSRLDSRTDAAGTTSYTYEPGTGRIQSISGPFDPTHTTTFDYKPSGRVWHQTEMRGANPAQSHLLTTYGYDNAGRPDEKKVTNPDGTTTYALFATGYNADSQVTSRTKKIADGTLTHPDNGTWQYTYDARGLLDTATDPDNVLTEYDFDGAGNRTLVKETLADAGVTIVTSSETTYLGMRPQKTTKAVAIDGVAGVPVETTYQHDGAGNLTRVDGPAEWRSFDYDEWGHMATANKGLPAEAGVAQHRYDYDALGRTIDKEIGVKEAGIETAVSRELFWHAGLSDELVQSSLRGPTGVVDSDTVVTSYGYRKGEPYATKKEVPLQDPPGTIPVSISWLGTDPHGDVVYSMGADRNLKGMQSYDPWGALRDDVGEKPHLGFQSDHADSDIGVVDMGARYYLPELGRFITQDTYTGVAGAPLTQNRYAYGLGDPVSMVDPTGHTAQKASGGGGCGCSSDPGPDPEPDEVLPTPNPSPGPCKVNACANAVIAAGDGVNVSGFVTLLMDGFGFVTGPGDLLDLGRCTVEKVNGSTSLDSNLLCAAAIPGAAGWAATSFKGTRASMRVAAAAGDLSKVLSAAQVAKVDRFIRKMPADVVSLTVRPLPNGGVAMYAVVPARNVPGSYAMYEKQVDAAGESLSYVKTVWAADTPLGGLPISVKDKLAKPEFTIIDRGEWGGR